MVRITGNIHQPAVFNNASHAASGIASQTYGVNHFNILIHSGSGRFLKPARFGLFISRTDSIGVQRQRGGSCACCFDKVPARYPAAADSLIIIIFAHHAGS
jgi:hypothetical protein